MANFEFEGIQELISELEGIGSGIDGISYAMVGESAEIMDDELSREILENTKEYGIGTLAGSIHHNEPKRNSWGYFTVSTARGKDAKKGSGEVRNQDKLFWKEYGNGRQGANPFMQKCVNTAEPKILERMQEVFDREVGGK